jgi:hypothetical protein
MPFIDTDALPDEYTENLPKTLELNEALTVRVATVGPQAPPQKFVALESLNYLITLVHDSRRLEWIVRDAVRDSLLTKLRNAKRRLEANDPAGANKDLKAFLSEVRGVSCEDFSCHGNPPATTEAYAVLYFNGRYLSDRLP